MAADPDQPRGSHHTILKLASVALLYPGMAWFFAGWFGLVVGVAVLMVWWVTRLPRRVFWLLAVLLLVAAPVALWVQGLPQSRIVGSNFGVRHLVAARLVTVSLSCAAFAGLIELLGLEFRHHVRLRVPTLVRAWADRTRHRFEPSGTGAAPPADPDPPPTDGFVPMT